MEFEAIIGKKNGRRIKLSDIKPIMECLLTNKGNTYEIGKHHGYRTNVNSVKGFHPVDNVASGKGFYIHLLGINDAIGIYASLTNSGFAIKDSKLKPRIYPKLRQRK